MHTVEKREILSHQNFFRQINSLVIYLVNALLSRNFCQKGVRVNFRYFSHCANLPFRSSNASSFERVMFSSRQLLGLLDSRCFTRRCDACTLSSSEAGLAGSVGLSHWDCLVNLLT